MEINAGGKVPELSRDTRNAMLRDQRGKCPICLTEIWNDAFLDHCHSTGKVRGLLCRACNIAIGRLGNDKETFRRAVAYLGLDSKDHDMSKVLAAAIERAFVSPSLCNGALEEANLVDAMWCLAGSIGRLATALHDERSSAPAGWNPKTSSELASQS